MQIAVAAAAAAAVASAHNYRQMLRQLSVSFASAGGGELWRHSICVTFAATTVAAVCCFCCCCRRLIRKTLWHLKYCGVRGICCCPGVVMGTGSSKGAVAVVKGAEGGGTGDRQQVGNLSSRRGEINVSIGNQHLYLPAWHLASSGKRVAINEAGNNKSKQKKNKLPIAHNLRSTISTSLVSVCYACVTPSAIRSRAEQVLYTYIAHCIAFPHNRRTFNYN